MNAIIQLKNINKSYGQHIIFQNYSLTINKNDIVVIMGVSGKGKTTLLNMIGLIEPIDSGKIYLYGQEIKPKEIRKIHKNKIGFLFQNFALLEDKSIFYNLSLVYPSLKDRKRNKEKILKILEDIGLKGYENKKVYECSGGQKQRIAIARVILHDSEIILADEPTGSLDKDNRDMIMKLLVDLKKKGKTIIVVSHDDELKKIADKIIEI